MRLTRVVVAGLAAVLIAAGGFGWYVANDTPQHRAPPSAQPAPQQPQPAPPGAQPRTPPQAGHRAPDTATPEHAKPRPDGDQPHASTRPPGDRPGRPIIIPYREGFGPWWGYPYGYPYGLPTTAAVVGDFRLGSRRHSAGCVSEGRVSLRRRILRGPRRRFRRDLPASDGDVWTASHRYPEARVRDACRRRQPRTRTDHHLQADDGAEDLGEPGICPVTLESPAVAFENVSLAFDDNSVLRERELSRCVPGA